MAKNILVIRHMYSADLFALETILKERGINFTKVEGYNTDLSKIDPLSYDAVIVLGGAMGVYQADLFPFIKDEIEIIRKCAEADHPYLGICLGAQLLAAALGKDVYKGANGREVGFMDLELTKEGAESPMRHFSPDLTRVFQWHGDTFDLPDDAVLLASSPKYKNQAYQVGQNMFAVQFHPEFDYPGLYNTIIESCADLDVDRMRDEAKMYLSTMERQMRAFADEILTRWNFTV